MKSAKYLYLLLAQAMLTAFSGRVIAFICDRSYL